VSDVSVCVRSLGEWCSTFRFVSGHWVNGVRSFGFVLKVTKSFVVGISALQTRPLRLLEMSDTNRPDTNRKHTARTVRFRTPVAVKQSILCLEPTQLPI